MRKVGLLIFSFLIFLLSFSFFSSKTFAAMENLSASSSSSPEINYELPYPGLLPDSPLYIFRVIRDRVVGFLISDPLKKAEFDLLQADKRLNAGIYLFNQGKTALSFSTVSKAENYFEEALGQVGQAKKQGKDIKDIEGRLRNALNKHEQELGILTAKARGNLKVSFQNELEKVTNFAERLSQ